MKKKLILALCMVAFAACLLAISASAVVVDGIDYSFNKTEATVTSANKSCEVVDVVIPETVVYEGNSYTVTVIASSAFRDNANVVSIKTPSTIRSIGEHAFRSMTALRTVELNAGEGFKAFSDAEFWGSAKLEFVDMSGCVGLTGIGNGGNYDDTFDGCKSLTRVVLPKGINYIGRHAFFNCSSLTTIENLDFTNVTYVGFKAFWGPKITGDVVLSENATYVGDHAFRETNITSIVMRAGEGATQAVMNDATFYNCKQLKYVVLPDNIQTIGQYTFNGCSSLEYLILGSGITTFSTNNTFTGCGALKAIIYQGSEDEFKALTGISALGTVEYKPFSEYAHGSLPAKRTVYYGAVVCDKCNGILSQEGFIFKDLLSEMKIGQECVHCGDENITDKFAPVFVDMGYSTFELNGNCSIVQGFMIDYESLAKYNENCEDKIGAFGVLAVADSKVENGVAFDENGIALDGVLSYEVATGHEYFEIKITNMPLDGIINNTETAYVDAKLHLCAYVFVGDTVHYVSEDYEGVTLGSAVSYNDKAAAE